MGRRARRREDGSIATPERPAPVPAAAAARASQPDAGRRSARSGDPGAAGPGPHRARPDRRAALTEAPKAPWAPFPLTELCILAGIVLIVVGFVVSERRVLLLAFGFALVSLAAAELALREHVAGYRSHSALLGAVSAILVVVVLRLGLLPLLGVKVPQEALTIVGVVVFGVAATGLRRLFQRRAGGLGFRV